MRKTNYRFARAERDRAKKAAAAGKSGDPRRRRGCRTDRREPAARKPIRTGVAPDAPALTNRQRLRAGRAGPERRLTAAVGGRQGYFNGV